jgi:hypothetical protein
MGHRDDLWLVAGGLMLLAGVLNLYVLSGLPEETGAWTWKERLVAMSRRSPIASVTSVACLVAAAILYIVSA